MIQYKERALDVLINLRCPQLSDFRWYKDVFISKVLSRNDCQQSYWKEKFIAGLPYFFAQKVRLNVANNDGNIDYPSLTYGDIISSINKIGLWLCNDLILKNQINKEKRYAKKELGTFCELLKELILYLMNMKQFSYFQQTQLTNIEKNMPFYMLV